MRNYYAWGLAVITLFVAPGLTGHAFAQMPFGAELHIGGGYTVPQQDFGKRFDGRGHFIIGGGFKILPFTELQAEYMYNTFGINRRTLASLNEPNGDAHMQSITVNPVVHLPVPGRFGLYGTAGVGFYHRTVEFTRPTTAVVTFFDPYFGYFFNAPVAANQVIGSKSRNAFGYNIGAGITYKLSGPAQLYFEARYHDVFTPHGHTQILPVTVGIRF